MQSKPSALQPVEAEGCCFLGPDRRLASLWQTYMAEVGRLVRFCCCVVQAKDLLVGEGLESPTLAGFSLTGAATWLEPREFCYSWCYVGNNFVLSGIREACACFSGNHSLHLSISFLSLGMIAGLHIEKFKG